MKKCAHAFPFGGMKRARIGRTKRGEEVLPAPLSELQNMRNLTASLRPAVA